MGVLVLRSSWTVEPSNPRSTVLAALVPAETRADRRLSWPFGTSVRGQSKTVVRWRRRTVPPVRWRRNETRRAADEFRAIVPSDPSGGHRRGWAHLWVSPSGIEPIQRVGQLYQEAARCVPGQPHRLDRFHRRADQRRHLGQRSHVAGGSGTRRLPERRALVSGLGVRAPRPAKPAAVLAQRRYVLLVVDLDAHYPVSAGQPHVCAATLKPRRRHREGGIGSRRGVLPSPADAD